MTTPTSSALAAIANGQMIALCCECGTQRTCKRLRNHVWEDYETWHRRVGDLKCATCKRITRHCAVTGHDYDEVIQAMALGMDAPNGWTDTKRIRERYRRGLPRNPYLVHLYWDSDRVKALEHNTMLVTLCGDRIKPRPEPRPNGKKRQKRIDEGRPRQVRDMEYEDPNTGLWWVEQDCVNCMRVWNQVKLERQREKLHKLMTTALAEVISGARWHQYDPHLKALIELLEAVHRA